MDETKHRFSPIPDLKNIESLDTSVLVYYCKKYRERVASYKNPEDVKTLEAINRTLDKRITSPSALLFQLTTPSQPNRSLSSTPSTAFVQRPFSSKRASVDQPVTPLRATLSATTLPSPISPEGGRLDEPTISCEDPSSTVYPGHDEKNETSIGIDCSSESLSFLHSNTADQKLKEALLSFKLLEEFLPTPQFASKQGTTSASQSGEWYLVFAERDDEEYLEVICPSNPIEIPKLVLRKRTRKTIPADLVEEKFDKRRRTESPSIERTL